MQATVMFDISLTQPVVDNVKPVSKLILPHAEVARLDISVDILSIVDESDDLEELDAQFEDCPHAEGALIDWEADEVFETWTEKLLDKYIIFAFLTQMV